MRWKGRRQSRNIEDRRGRKASGAKLAAGGGLGVLVVALVTLFLGGEAGELAKLLGNLQASGGGSVSAGDGELVQSEAEAELRDFVATVLADTEEVWAAQLNGYRETTLVLFRDGVDSACGSQSSAVGPFYCPADSKVYLDLEFFEDLARRHQAAGDFAQAYVVAHEVGHHVQNLLGTSTEVHRQRQRVGEAEANELSVRLELQADFYAGLWAHHAHRNWDILERGDVEEALNAASQIGDDTLQRKARGRVVPESFTHGTAEQRVRWFRLGLETGDLSRADTFSLPYGRL